MTGLTVRGVDIHNSRLKFDLVEGYDDMPEFDGLENTVIVGKPGEIDEEGVARRRALKFSGQISGEGATMQDRREDYHAAVAELWDAVAPTTDGILDGPGEVAVTGPYLGLPTGVTKTLQAKFAGQMWGERIGDWTSRALVFVMVCVEDPPDWQEL